jgi:hypothetical protein
VRPEADVAWRIEFGRGSGWHGLETVKVASDGSVVVHRFNQQADDGSWETASLTLPPDAVAEVLASVDKHQLLALRKTYRANNVADGTQWVFWFRQKQTEKSAYFDNEFPRAIEQFAGDLDRILAANGLGAAVWHPVPKAEARRHDRELWDSIRR